MLDTDIGSDIDDALCLSYLLAEPRCELLGITTVTGEPQKRAQLAHVLCANAGKEIPIHPGASNPLFGPQRQPSAPQFAALKDRALDKVFSSHKAIDFLQSTIREHPGEITLLCIGPLTNIALLFTMYPDIPGILKQLVLMCGVFHYCLPGLENHDYEWNATVDPFATKIVYRSHVPIHRSVGMDVTCQVVMEKKQAFSKFTVGLLQPVLPFARHFDYHQHITFHDPLAALTIFHPSVCTFDAGTVNLTIETEAHQARTFFHYGTIGSPHEVATDVDIDQFFSLFFGAFGNNSDLVN